MSIQNTIQWIKNESGFYTVEGYDFDIAKAGKGWVLTSGDESADHKTLKSAKAHAAEWITHYETPDDETELEDEEEPEEEYSSRMAKALAKARGSYTKSKASSGKSSLHNGDTLATMLAGCEPDEVAMLADLVCEAPMGTHYEKYSHLNQGQIRMNSGNKIRGRIKRGEILEQTVIDVAKANLATLMTEASE